MTPERITDKELDMLMCSSLISNEELIIPHGLANKTIQKLEKKSLLRELILELFVKVVMVLASLLVLAGVLVWFNGSGGLSKWYTYFFNNWHIISSLLFLVFITILIDQVGLKYYTAYKMKTA